MTKCPTCGGDLNYEPFCCRRVKLSPRARALSGQYGTGAEYALRPEDLSDEVPLTPGTLVVFTERLDPELAGEPGTIVEVEGDEGNPFTVAVEYLVAYGFGHYKTDWFLPEHVTEAT
jgi:endogenous inhibitor of DNA gyrase (YacG/DUF329 family)